MARTQFKQLDTEYKTTWYDRNCAINKTLRCAHTHKSWIGLISHRGYRLTNVWHVLVLLIENKERGKGSQTYQIQFFRIFKPKTLLNKRFSFSILLFKYVLGCCVALLRTAGAVASVCRACNEGWHIEEAAVTLSINSEILIPVSYTAAKALHFGCTHYTIHTHSHSQSVSTYAKFTQDMP